MAKGYVLINTAPTMIHEVYSELLKIDGIVELEELYGEYDLIAKVEVEDFAELGRLVTDRIRAVKGVIDTKTLTGMNP